MMKNLKIQKVEDQEEEYTCLPKKNYVEFLLALRDAQRVFFPTKRTSNGQNSKRKQRGKQRQKGFRKKLVKL
jgi:hypothetical protein